jgi:hypothetical protein
MIRRDVDFVLFWHVAGDKSKHMESKGKFSMPDYRDSLVGFLLYEMEGWMTGYQLITDPPAWFS